jgi:hypothetical protein
VLFQPIWWDAAEAFVILQEFSIQREGKGARWESEHGQLPGYPQCFPNDFLSIGWLYVLQDVGSNNCLEGAVREGKLGSRANDRQQRPYWRTRKFHVAAHKTMTIKIGKAIGPRTYFKNGLAVCDMTPQNSEYGKVSCCPVKQR